MTKADHFISRREFLQGAAGLTLAAATGLRLEASAKDEPAVKTPVVLIRNAKVLDDKGKISETILDSMLDQKQ
jgi:hypothetical protein